MAELRFNLDLIHVPIPCTVSWDTMRGDDRVRHCDQCRQSVYNLSELSRTEAEALLREKEGRACVQFYRRPDGSIVTRRCAVIRWWQTFWNGVTYGLLAALSLFVALRLPQRTEPVVFSKVGGTPCYYGDEELSPNKVPVAPQPRDVTPDP